MKCGARVASTPIVLLKVGERRSSSASEVKGKASRLHILEEGRVELVGE